MENTNPTFIVSLVTDKGRPTARRVTNCATPEDVVAHFAPTGHRVREISRVVATTVSEFVIL